MKLRLRQIELDDIQLLTAIENDEEEWYYGLQTQAFSRAHLEEFVLTLTHDFFRDQYLVLAIDVDGKSCGLIEVFDYVPKHLRAQVGIMILPEYRGKGVGNEALKLLSEYVRQHLHLNVLYATTAVTNMACRNAFGKAGYEECGTMKKWYCKDLNHYIDAVLLEKVI